jgi:hypothetical protein
MGKGNKKKEKKKEPEWAQTFPSAHSYFPNRPLPCYTARTARLTPPWSAPTGGPARSVTLVRACIRSSTLIAGPCRQVRLLPLAFRSLLQRAPSPPESVRFGRSVMGGLTGWRNLQRA